MLHLLADFTSGYSYPTTSTSAPSAGFWAGYFVFIVVAYLVMGFILSRVFKKAGRAPGAAFVPIYNTWVLLELGGESGANIFWVLLPFIGSIIFLVFYIKAMLELARRFGKGAAFAIFGLVIFSLIGFIILAFDDSKYEGAAEVRNNFDPQTGAPVAAGPAPQPPQDVVTPGTTPTDVPPAPEENPSPQNPEPPVSTPPTGGTVSG